jgi:hypothetical protein
MPSSGGTLYSLRALSAPHLEQWNLRSVPSTQSCSPPFGHADIHTTYALDEQPGADTVQPGPPHCPGNRKSRDR